jgi:hypothetical protein
VVLKVLKVVLKVVEWKLVVKWVVLKPLQKVVLKLHRKLQQVVKPKLVENLEVEKLAATNLNFRP